MTTTNDNNRTTFNIPVCSDDLRHINDACVDGGVIVEHGKRKKAVQSAINRVLDDEIYDRLQGWIDDAYREIEYLNERNDELSAEIDDITSNFRPQHPDDKPPIGHLVAEMRHNATIRGILTGKTLGYQKKQVSRTIEVLLSKMLLPNMENSHNVSYRNLRLFTTYIFRKCLSNNSLRKYINKYSDGSSQNCWRFGIKTFHDPEVQKKIDKIKKTQCPHDNQDVLKLLKRKIIVTPDKKFTRYPHSNLRVPYDVVYAVVYAWKEIRKLKAIEFPKDIVVELNQPIITPATKTSHLTLRPTPSRKYNYYLERKEPEKIENEKGEKVDPPEPPITEQAPDPYCEGYVIPGLDDKGSLIEYAQMLRKQADKIEKHLNEKKTMRFKQKMAKVS